LSSLRSKFLVRHTTDVQYTSSGVIVLPEISVSVSMFMACSETRDGGCDAKIELNKGRPTKRVLSQPKNVIGFY